MCDTGEIPKRADILQGVGVPRGCTLSPDLFKVYIIDMMLAVETQRATVGGGAVSGLMFANDFGGMSEAPEGLPKPK